MFFGFRRSELLLRLDWRQKNNADQRRQQQPSCSHTILSPLISRLFADTAFSAILRAVLAILAILAGLAGISTRASRGENVERDLINEKNR